MKIYIPALSEKIKLIEDWTFSLYPESRNIKAAKTLVLKFNDTYWNKTKAAYVWGRCGANGQLISSSETQTVTLAAETIVSIDRYYIRRGAKDYDSISLFAWPPNLKKSIRFWVKLKDFQPVIEDIKYEKDSQTSE